jgi:hypothetical protein
MRFKIHENKILKKGRELFNVQDNSELLRIGSGFYAELDKSTIGAGVGTVSSNLVRAGLKSKYKIGNLRMLTEDDGLLQLPYSNFIGPGTNLDSALKYGPVENGPASIKNSNGLSADQIAKQHDLMYHDVKTGNYTEKEKFNKIQQADDWMISEVRKLPDSKTRSLILKSLTTKYLAERASGKLYYGGRFIKSDNKKWLNDNMDAIINGTVFTGSLNTKVKTREQKIKDNLDKKKKEKDEQDAAEIEKKKPQSERDKSILHTDEVGYYDKNLSLDKKKRYKYILTLPKDINNNADRPPVEYLSIDPIVDYLGDEYIFRFPIFRIDENEGSFGIDNIYDIILKRDGEEYSNFENTDLNILNVLRYLANYELEEEEEPVYKLEKKYLRILQKFGILKDINTGEYTFQIPDVEVNRSTIGDYIYSKEHIKPIMLDKESIKDNNRRFNYVLEKIVKNLRLIYNKNETKRKTARSYINSIINKLSIQKNDIDQDNRPMFYNVKGKYMTRPVTNRIVGYTPDFVKLEDNFFNILHKHYYDINLLKDLEKILE